ncbi:DUF2155 domain-containing protein [Rhodobacteraceae bacterium SC52]|uniref:DUF2155 domain-containing protein n=1 Tax=Meridianimarinicoccus aquatilis TaxID=2552766 RepID=A0A4R6B468_9RHOB|nr:DUF2155 domain-containing protein [Fluviibacterium aquatile]QIE42873.1 DUF2155 domain-containing protein [Rhodobacteraceae bacterium SC52]TDL89513.1 DUF2155 domain-containing protein [Fluviibacterium aquatile]
MRWVALVALAAGLIVSAAHSQEVEQGTGVNLRALDRLSGYLTDLDVPIGGTVDYADRLDISVVECRYPADNPTGDAFAYLLIRDTVADQQVFEGWMIASSPALNALDHPRYDVWVLRCNRS